jgi:methanethiol S-methyltransferase
MNIIWIALAILFFGLIHSFLASNPVKNAVYRNFGSSFERFYRILYNLISLMTLLPLLIILAALPDFRLYKIPYPWILVSLSVQAAAGLSMIISLIQNGIMSFLGIDQLAFSPKATNTGLFMGGFYKWVRHPLYFFGLVILWLLPVMTINLLIVSAGLTIYTVAGMYLEEKRLLEEFGDIYREYQTQTPSLIPGIRLPILDRKSHLLHVKDHTDINQKQDA